MITPEYVEEYALDYGEDHPLYAASVLAEFPDSLEDSLIGRDAVESAMERWEAEVARVRRSCGGRNLAARCGWRLSFRAERSGAEEPALSLPGNLSGAGPAVDGRSPRDVSTSLNMTRPLPPTGEVPSFLRRQEPRSPVRAVDPNEPVYMGVDVARFGFDKSALCVRQGERVLSMRSFDRMDTMRLVHEVLGTVRETGAEAVFVDEGGVGRRRRGPAAGARRAGLRRPLRRLGAASHALLQPAVGDLLGAAEAVRPQAIAIPARRGAWPGSCSGCATTYRVRARCGWRASGRCASAACRRRTRRTLSRSRSSSRRRSASGRGRSRSSATTTRRRRGQRSRPSATTVRRRSRSRRPASGDGGGEGGASANRLGVW